MDLRERFKQHASDPNQAAWQEFELLRKNKKKKLLLYWISLFSTLLLLLMAGLFYINKPVVKDNTIADLSIDNTTPLKNQTKHTTKQLDLDEYKSEEPHTLSGVQTNVEAQESIIADQAEENSPININYNYGQSYDDGVIAGLSYNRPETSQVNDEFTNNSILEASVPTGEIEKELLYHQGTNHPGEIDYSTDKRSTPQRSNEQHVEDSESRIVESENSVSESNIKYLVVAIQALGNDRAAPELQADIDLEEQYSDDEPLGYRNSLNLSLGSAQGFIDGFSVANSVKKRGLSAQLEYYHLWNKLIGTGVTAGYINGVDIANPTLEIRDQEEILYFHFNLYLFLYNEKSHRAYINLGAGPTRTNRVLGTSTNINGTQFQDFQINTINSIGVTLAGSYEYQLGNRWVIGARGMIVSHNDGGWVASILGGYRF